LSSPEAIRLWIDSFQHNLKEIAVTAAADSPFFAVKPERAASMLDISRAKIYELLARGELPSFTIDSSRRIRVEDIHKYAKERLAADGDPEPAA
jgi:excisionase family DNA binding protein